jgi:hypothetical protein
MPRYKLRDEAGKDVGQIRLGDAPIREGDDLFRGGGRTFRVLAVMSADDESSVYAGCSKSSGGTSLCVKRGRGRRKARRRRHIASAPGSAR